MLIGGQLEGYKTNILSITKRKKRERKDRDTRSKKESHEEDDYEDELWISM